MVLILPQKWRESEKATTQSDSVNLLHCNFDTVLVILLVSGFALRGRRHRMRTEANYTILHAKLR